MANDRSCTLTYRRAEYLAKGARLKTLEEYLRAAHSKLRKVEDRSFQIRQDFVIEGRHRLDGKAGFFIHIAGFTPGEHASIVPRRIRTPEADLSTAPPPQGTEFMDGDLMLLAKDNHVILCSFDLHESNAKRFIDRLFEEAAFDDDAQKFGLAKVADIKKVKLIAREGVKTISLDASIFDATLGHLERSSLRQKLSGKFWEEIKAVFSHDKRFSELDEAENLSAHLIIKFDRRKKGGKLGRERIEAMAKRILADDDEGFKIETFGGGRLSADDIVLKKKVALPKFAKSVYHKDAWKQMALYLEELVQGGLLEQ